MFMRSLTDFLSNLCTFIGKSVADFSVVMSNGKLSTNVKLTVTLTNDNLLLSNPDPHLVVIVLLFPECHFSKRQFLERRFSPNDPFPRNVMQFNKEPE